MATNLELARLSEAVYINGGGNPDGNWTFFADSSSLGIGISSGYYAVAYRNTVTNEIVFAHRGTQGLADGNDILDDLRIALDKRPAQFTDAQQFYEAVRNVVNNDLDLSNLKITYVHTGHSLGGALANLMGIQTGEPVVGFNSLGVQDLVPTGTYANIRNISAAYDPAKLVGTRIGEVRSEFVSSYWFVPDSIEPLFALVLSRVAGMLPMFHFGFSQHSIANMVETLAALPVGAEGIPQAAIPLSFDENYQLSGSAIDEWSSLEAALNSVPILEQNLTTPTYDDEGQLTNAAILAEQTVDLDVSRGYGATGVSAFVAGANGSDFLSGGNGNDLLFGDDGDDTLSGEGGADILIGGLGFDSYLLGQGSDIIIDADGLGQLRYLNGDQSQSLILGVRESTDPQGQYYSPDGAFTFQWSGTPGDDLSVQTSGGTTTVKNYHPNDLGIRLVEQTPIVPLAAFTGSGNDDVDLIDLGLPTTMAGGQLLGYVSNMDYAYLETGEVFNYRNLPDTLGNLYYQQEIYTPTYRTVDYRWLYGAGGNDFMVGYTGAQNVLLDGGSGNDWIVADHKDLDEYVSWPIYLPPDDSSLSDFGATIDGGDGNDAIQGSFREDWIEAGAGHDQVQGGEEGDYIDGGTGNDWLSGSKLDGDADDDIIIGGPDSLAGGESDNDVLMGGGGKDILIGGAGNDLLYGDAEGYFMRRLIYTAPYSYIYPSGHPEIYYGRWSYGMVGWDGTTQTHILPTFYFDDVTELPLYRDASGYGNDYLEGGSGQDKLFGGGGDDVLGAGTDDDKLYGEGGDDDLSGGAGNDELWGDIDPSVYAQDRQITETHGTLAIFTRQHIDGPDVSGDDVLEGGTGDDNLHGGGGDDIYLFGLGNGHDTIEDNTVPNESNLIVFGDGISFEDIVATLNSDTLTLRVGTSGDAIDLLHFDVYGNHVVDYVQFLDRGLVPILDFVPHSMDGSAEDNVIYGSGQNDLIEALEGNDWVVTYVGDDTLNGGVGNDLLEGGPGDDTYIFNIGDGIDVIVDEAKPGEGNRVVFGEGITPASLSLGLGSLLIKVGSGGDALHLSIFDPNDVYGPHSIETFEFADGTRLSYNQLINHGFDLVGTDADNGISGTNGIDRIAGGNGNDHLQGGGGNDFLIGGIGEDQLYGGNGADTYVYNRGDGSDYIVDDGTDDVIDTVTFGEGVALDDITIVRAGNNLELRIADPASPLSTDRITIQGNYGDPAPLSIEQFRFADGTVLDGELAQIAATETGTSGTRIQQGGSADDVIHDFSGGDYLFGGAGNDRLEGADGDNYLAGEAGDDTLIGGMGIDTLNGGAGYDTYIHNYGDGSDTVLDADGLGRIVYRDAQGIEHVLGGGSRVSTGMYHDESGRFGYSLNGDTLTVSLDGQTALTIQDYDPAASTLGIGLRTYQPPEIHGVSSGPEPIRRVSVAADGTQALGASGGAAVSLSADGRLVAFESSATNLVSGDTNGTTDIFVRGLNTGEVIRVSTATDGSQANGGSYGAVLSADGRFVAFKSNASNLVAEDTNNRTDIFVKDLQTGAITRANTAADRSQANGSIGGWLYAPSISADGRYVTFISNASNLVPGDTNYAPDVFVKDMQTGAIIRASTTSSGNQAYADDNVIPISADGRFVAFISGASNLVAGDTNRLTDLFVKDLLTGSVVRANTTANGSQVTYGGISDTAALSADGRYVTFESSAYQLAPKSSYLNIYVKDLQSGAIVLANSAANGALGGSSAYTPSISADGRYVAFGGGSSNLVPGDTNGWNDIFVKDIQTGAIARVSIAANGTQANGMNEYPTVSADGKYVAFISNASNLVSEDTNNTSDIFVAPNPFFLPPPVTTGTNAPIALTDISIMDGDAGASPLTVTLDAGHGSLALLHAAGITFADTDGRDGTITFSGTLTDLNAALGAGILYTPAVNYVGNDTLKISINDHSFGDGLTDEANVALATTSASAPGPAIITGTASSDILIGGSGSNTLIGGAGDDVLVGGIGNDTYLYGLGDGSDSILDLDQSLGNTDTLSFGQGITPDSLSAEVSGYDLVIRIGDEILAIQNWFMGSDYRVERVQFDGGASYDGSWLASLGRHAPELGVPIPDQAVDEDSPFNFALSPGTFTDQDTANGDVLSYNARLVDGNALPTWLNFDSATGTLSGLAGNVMVGSYDIEVIATDLDGQSISDIFTLTVNNVNDAPVVMAAIPDTVTNEDAPFSFTLNANIFADDDLIHGDALTLSAALADGSILPDWLSFDASTGTFTGTPDNWDVGSYAVRVTATDSAGTNADDVFVVTVNNTNDIPLVANSIADQSTDEDSLYTFNLADVFTDDDLIHGDSLTLSASLADGSVLPDWLTFDAAAGTFSGTPDNWQVGTYNIRVTATDLTGTSASDVFSLTVNNVNDNPVLANALNDLATDEDAPFSFTVSADTFFDDDFIHGDSLTLSAMLADGGVLPDWLIFDADTGTFTGTPDNWNVGSYDIRVTATDTAGTSVSDVFSLTVNNVNDAPVLANPLLNQTATEGAAFGYTLAGDTFQDDDAIHGDTLSYTAGLADGSGLPSWLTFDAASPTFTGTVSADSTLVGTDGDDVLIDTDTGISGTWDIRVTAADASGISADDTFSLTLQGVPGNDTLQGGQGNDVLNGGGGNDTYIYTQGDGLDTLSDREGQDTVTFGAGFSFDNTVIRVDSTTGIAHLRVLDDCGCETQEGMDITLNPDGSSPIEIFSFTDGTSYTLADLTVQQKTWYGTNKANTIVTGRHDDTIYAGKGGDTVYSGTGNDTLYGEKGNDKLYGEGGNDSLFGDKGDDYLNGGCGNDLLDGGKGHNTLIGGEGNDTLILAEDSESNILFNLGDGWDTLKTAAKDEGHDNDIHFGSGITQENLWFTRNGDNLLISVLDTHDGMTLEGWYTNKHRPIEEIKTANGYELEDKQIELLVQAMASFSPIPGSGNVLPIEMPEQLQPVLAAAWESSHG